MIRLGSVKAKNILYYRDAEFDFDQRGVSMITGLNRNATELVRRNGAGKSMLFKILANLRYRDSLGNTRKANFATMFRSGSEAVYAYTTGDVSWQVTKRGSGKRYTVLRDGVDIEPRTPTIAEQIIDTSIPLSEEEWYSYVYLDTRRLGVFTVGTPTARHQYFTNLFRLNEIDEIGKRIKAYRDVLAATEHDLQTRRADLDALGPAMDTRQREREARRLDRRVERLEAELREAERAQEDRKLALRYADDVRRAGEYIAAEYKRLKAERGAWRDYDAAVDAARESERLRKRAVKDMEQANERLGTQEPYTRKGVLRVNARLVQERRQAEEARRVWDRASREWDDARATLRDLGAARDEARKLERKLVKTRRVEVVERDLDQVQSRIEQLKVHKQGECEVCGSHLDAKAAARQLEKAKDERDKLLDEAAAAADNADLARRIERLWNDERAEQFRKAEKVRKPGDKPRKFELREIEFIETRRLERPSSDPVEVRAAYKRQARARDSQTRVEAVRKRIDAGAKVETGIDARVSRLKRDLETERSALYAVQRDLGASRETDKTRRRLEAEIKALGEAIREKPLVEDLAEAYSPKGIKVDAIRALTTDIEEQMNRRSDLLFPEPFRWSIHVDAGVFDVLVERPGKVVSDVRELSGAESRAFALLWMISILPFIPAERRVNVVILDEFEAGLDDSSKDLLINTYLPALTAVVEHVIFITPHEFEPNEDRRVYVVEKNGSVSTIKQKEAR